MNCELKSVLKNKQHKQNERKKMKTCVF